MHFGKPSKRNPLLEYAEDDNAIIVECFDWKIVSLREFGTSKKHLRDDNHW